MKRLLYTMLFASVLAAPCAAENLLPPVQTFTTSNGITVVCIKDDLPRMTVSASVCSGYLYETPAKAGMTDLTARLLNICGTAAHPLADLDKAVDATGSRFSVRPDWETVTVSFQSLDGYADLAFETVSGLLTTPAFREQEFDLTRSLIKEKISREDQDPMSAAYGRAREMLFEGKGYGVRATAASVSSITLDDLRKQWFDSVKSGNLVVAVCSPRSVTEIKALMEKYFSGIAKGGRSDYQTSRPSAEKIRSLDSSVFFIERDIPQATIVFCAPAPDALQDSAYPLRIADELLGGGAFNAKLTKEIREKRGLSYSSGSIIRMRKNAGVFIAYSHCDADKAGQTYSLMKECVGQMKKGEFSSEDLTIAKQSIARSYIFEFDTPLNILSHYLSLWYNGQPESYLSEYPSKILFQDASSVTKAFRAVTDPGMVTVVIGNRSALEEMKKAGKVTELPDKRR